MPAKNRQIKPCGGDLPITVGDRRWITVPPNTVVRFANGSSVALPGGAMLCYSTRSEDIDPTDLDKLEKTLTTATDLPIDRSVVELPQPSTPRQPRAAPPK